jgi:glycosyltransferase involved in cell wall biosynthesis
MIAQSFAPQPSSTAPDLSLILPSYRDATRALHSALSLGDFFASSSLSWEVVIVDDGGGDFGAEWQELEPIRLCRLEANRGKGAAVRAGMLAARGQVRIYTDADLPYGMELFQVITEYILERGFHVVIGDRTLPDSSYALDVGWKRRVASSVYSRLVGKLVTGGFFDTQCGLKGFRGDVAEALFSISRIDRFAFDAEIIYLSLLHRLDIKRVPVRLRRNESSSIRLFRDSTKMFADTLGIKRNQLRGLYRSRELEEIVSRDHHAMSTKAIIPRDSADEYGLVACDVPQNSSD